MKTNKKKRYSIWKPKDKSSKDNKPVNTNTFGSFEVSGSNINEIRRTIESTKGRYFSVEFEKRSDGSNRTITGRTGVRKGVSGRGLSYDPDEHDLVILHDVKSQRHKAIPLDKIKKIRFNGEDHIF